MQNIPPEIYYAIGKELRNKDLKKMRATCKLMNYAVESLVFSSIHMVYYFTGDMVLIRPGYLGYFDTFKGDIFRHVQKIKITAVQQSTTPLSSPSFRPFIELDKAILKYFIPLLQNLRDISIAMEHKVPAWFFEALYPSLSSLPHIETITLRAKNEFYPPPQSLRPYVHIVMLTRTWDDAACVATRSFLQTTPAVRTMRLENGDALIRAGSRRSMGEILGGFGDRHLGIENLDTSGFDLLEDWPSIKDHFRYLGSLVIHDNADTPTGFWTCLMEEGAHRTIRQFSVKPDPRLTPHACLSPELWDFLWALEKLEFLQICIAFSEEEEEREMGESQGNEFYEKFLKKHGGTMKDLNLTAPIDCSWSITTPGHLELLVEACPKLVGLTLFTSHVGGETDMIVPVLDQIPSLPYLKSLELNGVVPTLYRMQGSEQQPFDIAACYREKEEALKEVILGYKPMDPKAFEGLVINSEKSCVFEFLEGAQAFTCNFGLPHFVRTELHFG
ncbi:hypothetical protein ARMSODRAFT_1084842 [Armillaria solidipes]|uniref:F-box domain-containing protein n=1 Tax=Armillaria solidipes TaxID=1076256 RepID=A0A2H3C059_9AGAR|nr:hypothetical protein ARMSODRAFT_1084842 [Armillaria solidipes]